MTTQFRDTAEEGYKSDARRLSARAWASGQFQNRLLWEQVYRFACSLTAQVLQATLRELFQGCFPLEFQFVETGHSEKSSRC